MPGKSPAALHLTSVWVHPVRHGALFICTNGKPFTFVEFLTLEHGFMRAEAGTTHLV